MIPRPPVPGGLFDLKTLSTNAALQNRKCCYANKVIAAGIWYT
jgi:hypothetical protein